MLSYPAHPAGQQLNTCTRYQFCRANPMAVTASANVTNPDPATARPDANMPPCVAVCTSTPNGNRIDPVSSAIASQRRVFSANATLSKTAPSTIISIANPIQWECASTCRTYLYLVSP